MIVSEARARRYRQVRVLEVLRASQLSANMRRIVLGGEEIEGFGAGPNIKLLIPAPGIDRPQWPLSGPDGRAIWPAAPYRPVTRTYSVRRFDAARGELLVDFVLHGDDGPASYWAARAKPGDVLGVGGPGGRLIPPSDFYLFAGDHSALPAISAAIEALPAYASGHAFIELPGPGDEVPIDAPPGVSITFLHRNGGRAEHTMLLANAVRDFRWPERQNIFAWIGCESAVVRTIRAFVRDEKKLDRRSIMAVGYWRVGMDETQYGRDLKNDRDADYFLAMKEEADEAGKL